MSYPQPNADLYATNLQKVFRLNTQVASPGDVYEVTQSGFAFAIGPESDIATVNITYWDAQMGPQFVNQETISPLRAYSAYVVAQNNDGQYMPANRPGRILIWPGDLIPPQDFLPTGFTPNQDRIVFEYPQLDVVQYLQPASSILSSRPDKTWFYQEVIMGLTNGYVLIPFYGRKYVSYTLDNTTANDVDLVLTALQFKISETSPAAYHQVVADTAIAGTTLQRSFSADDTGLCDYLMVKITPSVIATGIMLKIVTSDSAGCPVGGT